MTANEAAMAKRYLGGDCYVQSDGWNVVLTTEDGYRTTNTVILEPFVLNAFLQYLDALKEQAKD